MIKYLANIVTSSRILLSLALLFTHPFSASFQLFYILSGITDMIDGTIARTTHTASKFGERLDSIADFIFIVVCIIQLFPVLTIPLWLWIWTGIIAVIKLINVISGYVCKHKLVLPHTIADKITGFLLFILPLSMNFLPFHSAAFIVCIVATFAAIQEGHYIRTKNL